MRLVDMLVDVSAVSVNCVHFIISVYLSLHVYYLINSLSLCLFGRVCV